VLLRIVHGLVRRFELTLSVPRLQPSVAVLSNQTNLTLFVDSLPEVRDTPLVAVSLRVIDETHSNLLVTIRTAEVQTHWRILVATGETIHTADTDGRGIAQFEELSLNNIQKLRLSCTE